MMQSGADSPQSGIDSNASMSSQCRTSGLDLLPTQVTTWAQSNQIFICNSQAMGDNYLVKNPGKVCQLREKFCKLHEKFCEIREFFWC